MAKPVKNLIVISDTHVGCGLALMRASGAKLDDGGTVRPSRLQRKVWAVWREFWDKWVPKVTRGEDYAVIHNGDAIDGSHHRATTQWSQNLGDQAEEAYQILKPIVDKCRGRYYHIRGTEAHVGQSGTEEERLAKRLGAIPNEDGQHARWDLWKTLGPHLIHFTHHIGTTSSAAHETSAVNAEIASAFTESGRWRRKPPTVIVRSHRHRTCEVRLPGANGYFVSCVTPSWQLKTPYVFKIPGGRNSTPQLGGMLIRLGDEEIYTRYFVHDIGRSHAE